MKIYDFYKLEEKVSFLIKDENNRKIDIYLLEDAYFINKENIYPDILLYSFKNKKLFNPIQETVMSLKSVNSDKTHQFKINNILNIYEQPVFYFIYNTDNYFHFLYDTIPYLKSFKFLKKTIPNLKLLINFPNNFKKELYKFVSETYDILKINKEDIIFVDHNTRYKNIYISDSYTYGFDPNLPPRKEIYELYEDMKNHKGNFNLSNLPKKIYISRRSWVHGNLSNIGTNYTSRRKMVNEDELVRRLQLEGFEEIFTENMTMHEKITYFKNAEYIVGAIGGGMCNMLFCENLIKSLTICSPHFLEVNKRFLYSLNNKNNILFKKNKHTSNEEFKVNMRVKTNSGIIGEIENIEDPYLIIKYSNKKVSGWNSHGDYNILKINKIFVQKLDDGLNSEWECDINSLMDLLK
jgi:hypothetical protein